MAEQRQDLNVFLKYPGFVSIVFGTAVGVGFILLLYVNAGHH